DEVEGVPGGQVLDVRERAGGEIVERVDLPAFGEEKLRDMRADEAGSAGHERLPLLARVCHGRDTAYRTVPLPVRSVALAAAAPLQPAPRLPLLGAQPRVLADRERA